MHAVGADQCIASHRAAVLQLKSYARIVLRKTCAAGAEMDGIRPCPSNRAGQHFQQIWAVNSEIRKTVALDRRRPQIEELPGLARLPVPDFLALRFAGQCPQLVPHAEGVENASAVRSELHARADLLQLGRL